MRRIAVFFTLIVFLVTLAGSASAQAGNATIRVLDRNGVEITDLVDGNSIRVNVKLSANVTADTDALFFLGGIISEVASCSIKAGSDTCTSPLFPTLGWLWGIDGAAHAENTLKVAVAGQGTPASLTLRVRPRPVVMVHGFISSWETWQSYLGLNGYLASMGLQGFAVGADERGGYRVRGPRLGGCDPFVLNLRTEGAFAPFPQTRSCQAHAPNAGFCSVCPCGMRAHAVVRSVKAVQS